MSVTSEKLQSATLPYGFLKAKLKGGLYFDGSAEDQAVLKVYSTDASVYQEKPFAVAHPYDATDLRHLIDFANTNKVTLLPRAAGTSLAGQVVGKGIVVDTSRHLTGILELNATKKWVRVQPGVIRDDLNAFLRPHGLMFGPETSTSNRAMIGGMIGNNSCGLHSIIWGNTRDNLISVKGLLADGSEVIFERLDKAGLESKCRLQNLEGKIYRDIIALLQDGKAGQVIDAGFPAPGVTRRNTGYALDFLLDRYRKDRSLNLSDLIAGSEGTLCVITEATLRLLDLPPAVQGVVAVHCNTIHESLIVNLVALEHRCAASELVDHFILEFTKGSPEHSRNRSFIQGDPQAILLVEFFSETNEEFARKVNDFTAELVRRQLGYAYPLLTGAESTKAWDVRKAGLGLLRNQPGNTLPVNLIEDCAVSAEDLPAYIEDVETLLKGLGVQYAMYAHAGAGELHVEPMVNLKSAEGRVLFRKILAETVKILRKYKGALSGEHGDGRLRGEFIPEIMGMEAYSLFRRVKGIFDPAGIFNKGKITNTPAMDAFFRSQDVGQETVPKTLFDFSKHGSILGLAERCSGSGDCRKTEISGGTMCPSYMATRHEKDTTRARANILRQYYSGGKSLAVDKQEAEEVRAVLDLCLSCKGCKSECPSVVDISKMKAEFTQQYYDKHGSGIRAKAIAWFPAQMKLASLLPGIYNRFASGGITGKTINKILGIHERRSFPPLTGQTFDQWFAKWSKTTEQNATLGYVRILCDEFSQYNDVTIASTMVKLLHRLGYGILYDGHYVSGRTFLSKGFVRKAKEIAIKNVKRYGGLIKSDVPMIGIEPSAVLTLRDEYIDLVPGELKEQARSISSRAFLFEEWFINEINRGLITSDLFTEDAGRVVIHEHCHQKAITAPGLSEKCFRIIKNYQTERIRSGCCGMAGSFGYEEEHYDVSMKIGELVLFPFLRKEKENVIIAASGTSCRHQIHDGTGRNAKHVIEILFEALR